MYVGWLLVLAGSNVVEVLVEWSWSQKSVQKKEKQKKSQKIKRNVKKAGSKDKENTKKKIKA